MAFQNGTRWEGGFPMSGVDVAQRAPAFSCRRRPVLQRLKPVLPRRLFVAVETATHNVTYNHGNSLALQRTDLEKRKRPPDEPEAFKIVKNLG
jgi:hypothetical protein